MTRLRALPIALSLALLATALPLAAQEEPAGRFSDRIQVTEVLLDVLVTDTAGNVVIGLDERDFIVEEEGQPIAIASATFYGSERLLDSPARAARLAPTAAPPTGRFFILFFHDTRREAPRLLRQQRDAAVQSRRWVEKSLAENDWVAVVSYYAKLRIHQDFTRDRALVFAALDSVSLGKDPGATWSAAAQLGDGPSLTRYLAQGKELRKQTTRFQDGLKVIGDAAANIKGRKNMVLFSIGFGDVDRFGWQPDQRFYPRTQQALNDANVAVYAIGLAGNSFIRDPVIEALSHSLSQLAVDTGGHHYPTFASFGAPLSEVAADNGGYYLLSYSTEYAAGDSGYREVSVKTTNPSLRVRARDGYLFGG
jgi:VWFA-related protein